MKQEKRIFPQKIYELGIINKRPCNDDITLKPVWKRNDFSLCSKRPRVQVIGVTVNVVSQALGLIHSGSNHSGSNVVS